MVTVITSMFTSWRVEGEREVEKRSGELCQDVYLCYKGPNFNGKTAGGAQTTAHQETDNTKP